MTTATTPNSRIQALWDRLDSDPAAVAETLAGEQSLPEAGLQLRGLARLDSGDAAGAHADFSAVLALDAQNVVARRHRALAAFQLGRRADSAADLEDGPLFPHQPFLARFLSLFWPLQFTEPGLHSAAWRGADDASQPASASRRSTVRRAPTMFLDGRWGEAWQLVRAARSQHPDDVELRALEAFLQLNRGEWQEAAEFLDPAVEAALARFLETRAEHDLPEPDLVVEYGWRLHLEGLHGPALAVLSTVRPVGPDDYQAHILSAMAWTTLGRAEPARRCLDTAFAHYFLDSWDLVVRPFHRRVVAWLREEPARG